MLKKCHFIGIGGIGMSGLARILLEKKVEVTGSDISTSYVTEGLVKAGAQVFIGHSSRHIAPDTTVIYSTEIKENNPELETAVKLKCPLLHRSDLLKIVMEGKKTLAVAGTHGKTTTSALLTTVLSEGKLSPSFAVGGILKQFQSNAAHGVGAYFVAEADESDGSFLKYDPYGAIITNIDLDHMNYYLNEERLQDAFYEFANKVKSSDHLFWCYDDERLRKLQLKGFSYGTEDKADLKISNIKQNGFGLVFDIDFQGKHYSDVQAHLSGHHNALNASAVFGLALMLGIEEKAIRGALASFQGVKRRCEKKGEVKSVLVLDDYAHHPTEIDTTLKGIKKAVKERRVIAVFQPHRFSRTKDCLGTFRGIFDAVDEVIVTDIFSAGEKEIPGVTTEAVFNEIKSTCKATTRYIEREKILDFLLNYVRPHDVCVTLGAGDITKLGGELVETLKTTPLQKYKVGVFFGGKSVEHEISLLSARHILDSLDPELYDIIPFGITREGKWENEETLIQDLLKCDIFFPVLHGTNGEDGTIQGFFEILNKPYVGCDYRSAAIAMDKALTKKLAILANIPTLPFISFSEREWLKDKSYFFDEILEKLTFPLFVKPAHLGSSVGIQKIEKKEDLLKGIEEAFLYDTSLVIEKGIQCREIEFAVFGNGDITVTPPGEVCTEGKFYDYAAKYGRQATKTECVAQLDIKLQQDGMALAKRAYQAISCIGFARVDFFLDHENKFWLNEINPIPGFTKNSLYPQMAAQFGLNSVDLVNQLIILSLAEKRYKDSKR
jgi:UDP-N-acetylmuramate--alanine ligase